MFDNQKIKLVLAIMMVGLVGAQQCTSSSNERCLCTSVTPYCPCSALTPTNTLNFASTYYSHLVSVSGQGCKPCSAACQQCNSPVTCSQCLSSFELIGTACVPCPVNCQKCSNNVCTVCVIGYYLDYQTNCQSCPIKGTNICTINSLISCANSYALDNNAANCVQCDPNCQQCSSTTKCAICNSGYFVSNFSCQACQSQCLTCSSVSSCLLCANGSLYYNSSLGLCSPGTSSNCVIFLNSTRCLQCDSFSYLNSSGICVLIQSSSLITKCSVNQMISNALSCRNCSNGYYNTSSGCSYGCSLLCTACMGAHYGLCYGCISNVVLSNMNCLPNFNINGGAAYQLYYTAYNNPTFFVPSSPLGTSNCLPEVICGGNTVSFFLSNLQSYQITLQWKAYLYSSNQTNPSYSVIFNNSGNNASYSFSISNENCLSNCVTTCVDKKSITIYGIILNSNQVKFISNASNIGVSEVFIIAYRCGGVQGSACLQCSSISQCTKCVDPNYYISGYTCVLSCPSSYYIRVAYRTCLNLCVSGTYVVAAQQLCLECVSPCLTCTSNSSCLSCTNGTFLYGMLCLQDCPQSFYPNNMRQTCNACIRPCLTCLSNIKCLSCIYGFFQNTTNSCVLDCQLGSYGNIRSLNCQLCIVPCLTCSSTIGSQCLSCLTGFYYFNFKCFSTCPDGYYDYPPDSCVQCASICILCSANPYNCTSCSLGYYLFNFTCIAQCPSTYYNNPINNQCEVCPPNCLICENNLYCKTCSSNYSLFALNNSCFLSCPDFYYSLGGKCQSCQLPCRTCFSFSGCLSCKGLFLYNNSCNSICPSGTYGQVSNMQCLKCKLSVCLNCYNSPIYCTKCIPSLILFNNQCLQQCPVGYFYQKVDNTCLLCQDSCLVCSNFTFCFNCSSYYILQEGRCVTQCETGYYSTMENQTMTCQSCPTSCSSCQIQNKLLICSICTSGYFLSLNQCLTTCPIYYYGSNLICYACSLPCLLCSSDTNCFSCNQTFGALLNGSCYGTCPISYYINKMQNTCDKCSNICLKCQTSATNCTACNSGLLLQGGSCWFICPEGYYSTASSSFCLRCSLPCSTCSSSPTNCTNCIGLLILINGQCFQACGTGFYVYNSSCKACPFSCLTCINSSYCYSCNLGYYLDNNYSCTTICPAGTFPYIGLCRKCIYPCQTCNTTQICLSCITGFLHSGNCISSCPSSTYLNQSLAECQACPSNCSSCSNPSNCTECSLGVLVSGNCRQNCPEGYYNYYSICAPCMYGCSNCSDSNYCNRCDIGYLHQGLCLQFCPDGWVNNINSPVSSCEPCIVNCLKCSIQPNKCTLCANGLFLYVFSCVSTCPLGAYQDYQSRTCLTCKTPCQTCNNGYSCNSCIYGYLLYSQQSGNQCIVGPYCPNSFYLNLKQNICVYECPSDLYIEPTHLTCSNPCPSTYLLYKQNLTCLSYCPSGMWINKNFVCESSTPPVELPYFNCEPLILRNLLVINCIFSINIVNINALTINNFSVYGISGLQFEEIIIVSSRQLRLVTTLPSMAVRAVYVNIALNQRYQLYSIVQAQQNYSLNQSQRRLFTSYNIPLQNTNSTFLMEEYFSFSQDQRQTGLQLLQIAQSICIGAFIFWFFALLKNMKSTSVTFIFTLQWVYSLSLLDTTFAPNIGQFVEGFKISNLLFNLVPPNDSSLWLINSQYRQSLWGIVDLFQFKSVIFPSLCVYIFFGCIYSVTYYFSWLYKDEPRKVQKDSLKQIKINEQSINGKQIQSKSQKISNLSRNKSINNNQTSPKLQEQKLDDESISTRYKIGQRCKLINVRFYYNYWMHCILLTVSPISIAFYCQFIQANVLSLIFALFFCVFYIIIIISFIRHSLTQQKLFVSTKYWFLILIQTIIQNGLAVMATAQVYLGIMIFTFLINIYVWNRIFSSKRSNQLKHFYQINDLIRIILLVQILVGYISKKKWSASTYYYYSWIIVATLLLLIVFIAIQSTKQFFDRQEGTKQKVVHLKKQSQDNEVASKQEESQKSKKSTFQKLQKKKKKQNLIDEQEEEQIQKEEFFSQHSPVVDSDSEKDIIDFDEMQEDQSHSTAPKELIRYDKNKKRQ